MKIFEGQKGKQCDDAIYLTYTHKQCPCCNAVKAVDLFYRKITKTARGWAWDSKCIDCCREECRNYGKNAKDLRNAYLRNWRKKNPVAAVATDKRRHLKRKYGLSPDQVEEMRASQDGACAICQRKTTRLLVDHCHTKGHVRALLCQTCNTFLGWYEKKAETILRFERYLAATRR